MKSLLVAIIAATTMASGAGPPAPPSQAIVDRSFSITVPLGDDVYGMKVDIAGTSVSIILSKVDSAELGDETRPCV